MASKVEVLVDSFQLSSKPFIFGHPGGESVALIEGARRADYPHGTGNRDDPLTRPGPLRISREPVLPGRTLR